MIPLALKVLAAGIPALGALALLALLAPARQRLVQGAVAGVSGTGAMISLLVLTGGGAADFPIPIGLPGTVASLRVDALAALFLLVLFIPAGVGALFALMDAKPDPIGPAIPALIAGGMVCLLAADAVLLLVAVGLVLLLLGGLAILPGGTSAGERSTGPCIGFACLLGAFALLTALQSATANPGFPALRAATPESFAVLLLGTLGVALLTSLPPFARLAKDPRSSQVAALLYAGLRLVPIYVLIRLLMDLSGPALPIWWGVPPLVLGAAASLSGAYRAGQGDTLRAVIVAITDLNLGLIVAGIGLALVARGADLAPLATLALAASLLHALHHAVFATLLLLGAGAAEQGAGTGVLDHGGGLIQAMPVTSLCLLAGAFAASFLPPGPAFASLWLLFQALFAAPRAGGLGLGILLGVIAAVVALAVALGTAALLRLVGVALLGRPRTPRVAAAEDANRGARGVLIGLSASVAVLGVLPGITLALIAPAARLLTGSDIALQDRLTLRPAADFSGYSAVWLTMLILGAGAAICLALRGWAVEGHRRTPAWNDGFAAPPPWLPLGDPATQGSAGGFSRALGAVFAGLLPAFPGLTFVTARLSQVASRVRECTAWAGQLRADHALRALFALLFVLLMLLAAR